MKIIEAMKKCKSLTVKAEDLKKKVSVHCAALSFETPPYANQKEQVQQWMQAYSDVLKEILRLRVAIQRTNIIEEVVIDMDGTPVKKCIAEWIHRRRDLAKLEESAWASLTDRNLKEGQMQSTQGEVQQVKIVRFYDPAFRDAMVSMYRNEPFAIDAALEVVNATTDVVE